MHSPLLDGAAIAELRLRALRLLDHPSDRAVLQRHHGESLSSRLGPGMDYEESRLYQPGDDRRHMNWRVTARTNTPHVKVFREERQPGAFILLDRRTAMRFGTRVRLKVTQALRATVLLAFYHHYCGRMVGGAVLDETLVQLSTFNDEQGLLGFINAVNRPCPPRPVSLPEVSLDHSLRFLQGALVHGTQLVLISDFFDATPQCRPVLAQLAAEHDVSAIHIVDPGEEQLPAAGTLRLTDSDVFRAREINTADTRLSVRYQDDAGQHFAERESLLRAAGMHYCRLLTTSDHFESDLSLTSFKE